MSRHVRYKDVVASGMAKAHLSMMQSEELARKEVRNSPQEDVHAQDQTVTKHRKPQSAIMPFKIIASPLIVLSARTSLDGGTARHSNIRIAIISGVFRRRWRTFSRYSSTDIGAHPSFELIMKHGPGLRTPATLKRRYLPVQPKLG